MRYLFPVEMKKISAILLVVNHNDLFDFIYANIQGKTSFA
jgi:hypothetical protein